VIAAVRGATVRLSLPLAILTVAVAMLLTPAAPLHVREYEVLRVTAPVLCEPLTASVPLQPPVAVHELALVDVQLSVDALPLATDTGVAARAAVGTTLIPALTGALEPPGPLHDRTNVEFLVNGPVV